VTAALSAEALAARYPGQPESTPALANVTLTVRPGERLLLVGPNGAGKSTFIRVFAGLMRPARGQASVLGRPPRHARQLLGVVSHATFLYDELTAAENLRLYAELYGVPAAGRRAEALLEHIGLAQAAGELVGRLSRGQQQRLAIARAVVHDPPVLLLDEPDTGLDIAAFEVLQTLVGQPGRTVVLTTHNLAAGLRLGNRVAVLARGRLVEERADATPADAVSLSDLLHRLATAA
jgi:ABC-type multidrug transport system ATPase subunit